MPLISGTYNETTVAANTAMAMGFFPRAKDNLYKRLARSYISTRLVEPHAQIGSVPPLTLYNGQMAETDVPSFKMQVPNPVFRNAIAISQQSLEGDQTGTIIKLGQAIGMRLAEFPDQLLCKRILKGSTANSQYQTFEGTQYTTTFDAQPLFSASHSLYAGGTQSNIIQGTLPATKALLVDDDYPTNVSRVLSDLQNVLSKIKTVKDTAGIPFFPTIDTKKSIVVVGPPVLEPIFQLAFRSPGSMVNMTTNIAPMFVKDCFTHGYLEGLRDPETGATITPVNETDYYVFVMDDYVAPFYNQIFRPLKPAEMFPPGYNIEGTIDAIMKENSDITLEEATSWASTRIDTTFNKIGSNSDAYTIQNEKFLVSARWRGNLVYGMWFTAYRIKPVGGS